MTNAADDPACGRRFTKAERRQAVADLEQWMTSAAMDARFDALSAVSGEHFFLHGENQFMQDAYIAGRFALARTANRVRLCADERPDFEIDIGGVVQRFEATEADMPGRRRGDEYKATLSKPKNTVRVDQAEIAANIAAVPNAIRTCAAAKAGGGYDPAWGLVIMLNVATYGCDQEEIEGCFEAATKPAADAFREVWVLWGRDAYRTWPQGGPRPARRVDEPANFDLSEILGDG